MLLRVFVVITFTIFLHPTIALSQTVENAKEIAQIDSAMAIQNERLSTLQRQVADIQMRIAEVESVIDSLEAEKSEHLARNREAEVGKYFIVTRMEKTLRRSAFISGAKLGDVPSKTKLRVLGKEKNYWLVEYDGQTGYILDNFVDVSNAIDAEALKELRAKAEQVSQERRERKREERLRREREEERQLLEELEQERADRLRQRREEHGVKSFVVESVSTSRPNSAGGVDVDIRFNYFGDERTIKYVTFYVAPYNPVGDRVQSRTSGKSIMQLRLTGPLESAVSDRYIDYENVWYNSTITCAELTRMDVEYTNGAEYVYINELPKVLAADFDNSCEYSD